MGNERRNVMTSIDQMQKDIEGMSVVVEYFTKNSDKIPTLLQLKFLEETLNYAERIKPLYITALALRGDPEKGE